MSKTGIVFDIKQMAVFDGPGIRTTVFFKGCPLRCQWCHNPEGLSFFPQLMVSHNSCIHCGNCTAACSHPNQCVNCGECVSVCPLRLRRIAGTRYTAKDLAGILLQNKDILQANQGGVTFTGGEPLAQHEFLLELIDELEGMHTAIETSGYCAPESFKSVIDRLDYVIMDIKLVDSGLHKQYTGVDNELILKNLSYLGRSGKPFVIRVPLIPGVNDTDDNINATAELVQGMECLQKVELLPYHQTAGAKFSMIGEQYSPSFNTEQPANRNTSCFANHGIACSVL
jgi:pyruvate formate lyase activating enzyme